MIKEQALREAIAEVQGKRNPNRDDCMMLAAFYIIQDRLYPEDQEREVSGYSTSPAPDVERWSASIGEDASEFLLTVRDKPPAQVLSILDELMQTIRAIYPRLYEATIRELKN